MTNGTSFRSAAAHGLSWGDAAQDCVTQLGGQHLASGLESLGFLYVTEPLARDFQSIIDYLRQETGVVQWVGCIGSGICGTGVEFHEGRAVAVMIADLPRGSFAIMPSLLQPEDIGDLPSDDWDDAEPPLLAVVHGDPRNDAVRDMIGVLPDALDGYLIGGLTAAPGGPAQVAGKLTGGGLSGALISAAVPVIVGVTQGCRPIGPPRQVTQMDGDWVAQIDGRPALEALKADLGPEEFAQLKQLGGMIHAGLPVDGSDTAEYVVRNLVAVDPQEGRLGISADLTGGERLLFVRRDSDAAEQDLRTMIRRLLGRNPGTPRGALYFSCLARGPNMFEDDPSELDIVREELGDVPLAGFFANGEINNNRIYAYTGVLCLFL